MESKLKLPFNLFIETKKRRKSMHDSDDNDETDEIGSLPEFDSRSTTSSLTSRSFALRSTIGGRQSSFKRKQSRSSLFGSILKSSSRSKKQSEVKMTEVEGLLRNEISQLKSSHGSEVALLHYKLLQRENCIETLEEALQTQQSTLVQFESEIQGLKDRVQDAEERNHALKITCMQSSSRSLCSKSINTSMPVEEKLGEGKYTGVITEDDNSQVSSTECKEKNLDFDSASTNTSNTTGEDSINNRSCSNSTNSRMKRRPRGSMSSATTRERNNDEISCDGSRASVRSRRSNADLPDYKLYRGGLDDFEQNEKSKRLRQQSRMRAQAKRTNRGKAEGEESSTSKEKNNVNRTGEKRVSKRKTARPSKGRGSSNSVVSKDTAITAKTSEMSNSSSLMQQ